MRFSPFFLILLAFSVLIHSEGSAQLPSVRVPGGDKKPATTPKFRLSAAQTPAAEKKEPKPASAKKPDFAPGAIVPGVLEKKSAVASLPEELQPLAKAGALAMAEQDFEKAKAAFAKMVEAVPRNELARANLGTAEYRLKNYPAARENLKIALEINPQIGKNWVTLGLVHFRENNLELAISSLTRAIAVEPRNAKAHQYLAIVANAYGWPDAAEKELQKSLQIDPADPDAHFNLAVLYLEKSPVPFELARRHYATAVELGAKPDPDLVARIKNAEIAAKQSTD